MASAGNHLFWTSLSITDDCPVSWSVENNKLKSIHAYVCVAPLYYVNGSVKAETNERAMPTELAIRLENHRLVTVPILRSPVDRSSQQTYELVGLWSHIHWSTVCDEFQEFCLIHNQLQGIVVS